MRTLPSLGCVICAARCLPSTTENAVTLWALAQDIPKCFVTDRLPMPHQGLGPAFQHKSARKFPNPARNEKRLKRQWIALPSFDYRATRVAQFWTIVLRGSDAFDCGIAKLNATYHANQFGPPRSTAYHDAARKTG